MKQAVILAGGKGTRLRGSLGPLPKPLADICGTPVLGRQIALAKAHGFDEVLVLVNHGAEHIVRYCAGEARKGLRIECIDDGTPRGTAGAVLAAFDRLAAEFLVMYGDTMLEVDLGRFHAFHAQQPDAAATLFLHPNDHPQDSDLVEIDEGGRVQALHGYPHDASRDYPNLVNAALYWVRKEALAPWRGERGALDFGKHLFPAMLTRGLELRGYPSPEYIKDIGTPQRLERVRADFRAGRIGRASLARPQAIVFIDRDGTINREVDHLREPAQFELLPGIAGALRRLNQSDYRACVITNQPVVARGECTEEGLRRIHNRMETQLGAQGAYLDRIYYCPHHPDRGFAGERPELKVACDCRKPGTGMVERALADFNGARERSWLIGDSTVEMECARRARLRSVLVETGYAGLDYRAWAAPFAVVPDLAAAVAFILDRYPLLFGYCADLAAGIGAGAIVLVGGQSRSGKSTLANVLADALRAAGKGALVLSADRWLRPGHERTSGVLGRFDMRALQQLLDALADRSRRPSRLELPGYHKLTKTRVEAVESEALAPEDVILIEGVVALALETGHDTETHRFHVEVGEEERKWRVVNEYRLRGANELQAMEVYASRRQEEYPVIEALALRGARRIPLSSVPGGEGAALVAAPGRP